MIAPSLRSGAALTAGIGVIACVIAVPFGRDGVNRREGWSDPPMWHEIAWPLPRDAWEPGRAFKCASPQCGGDTEVYVRPKLGFCNCTTGVSDDEEVDRVTDLDLITPYFVPSGAGRAIETAGLRGRARHYELHYIDGRSRSALGMALSRKCDVVVATAHGAATLLPDQLFVADLLASEPVRAWIEAQLEGRRRAAAF